MRNHYVVIKVKELLVFHYPTYEHPYLHVLQLLE